MANFPISKSIYMALIFFLCAGTLSIRPVSSAELVDCDALIAPKIWRVFSGSSFLIPEKTKQEYLLQCNESEANNSSLTQKLLNIAAVFWVNGRRKEAILVLQRFAKIDPKIGQVALASSEENRSKRLKKLRILGKQGNKIARIEAAMNAPANSYYAKYIIQNLKLEALKGDAEAAFQLGLVYLDPDIGILNYNKVNFYFDFASLSKNPGIIYLIAQFYSDFSQIANGDKSVRLMMRAATQGNSDAVRLLAEAFGGTGVAGRYRKRIIRILCQKNNYTYASKIVEEHKEKLSCFTNE